MIPDDKIKALIAQHLPQAVGEELQAELAELKELRLNKGKLEGRVTEAFAERDRHSSTITVLRAQLKRAEDLDAREAAVKVKEDNVRFIEHKAMMMDQRHNEMFALVGMVFKSPMFRVQQSGSIPVPVAGMAADPSRGMYGSAGTVMPSNMSMTTDTTVSP